MTTMDTRAAVREPAVRARLGTRNRNGTPWITRPRVGLLVPKLQPWGQDVIYVRRPKDPVPARTAEPRSSAVQYMDRYGWYVAARSIVRAIVATYQFGRAHWVGLAPWYGYLLALVVHGLVVGGLPGTTALHVYAYASGIGAARWYLHRYRHGPRGVPVDRSRLAGEAYRKARGTARRMVRDWPIHMRNADMVGTELRRITFDQWSVSLDIHTTHKLGVAEIRKRLEILERCFPKTRRDSSRVETRGEYARDARLRFMLEDPHALPISPPALEGDNHMIPIGLFETGEEVFIDILKHLLIAGMSGAGKSSLIQVLIRALTRIPWIAVVAVDLSPGAPEFGRWSGRVAAVASTKEEVRHALAVLNDGMTRRGDIMKERGWQKWRATAAEPHIVFIVDEAQGLTSAGLTEELADVAALLRKYGGTLVLATQYPIAANIPSTVKQQMRQTIGLHTKDEVAARVIFGSNADKEGWNTKKVPQPKFLIQTEGGYTDPLLAQSYYLDEDDLAREIQTSPRPVKVDAATWPIDHMNVPEIEGDDPYDVVDAYVVEPNNIEKVYAVLRHDDTHRNEIENATGLDQKTVDKWLRTLIEQGRAVKVGRARYRRVLP